MRRRLPFAPLLTPMFALPLAGCMSFAPEPEVPPVAAAIPASFPAVADAGEYQPQAWWSDFQDPVLDTLVERALAANLDIAQAAARVERASAQARIARAALLPSVEGTGGASYSSTPVSGGAFANFPGAPTRIDNQTYSLGLGASYEVDLFGRVRGDLAAARADALAAQQDYRAVRLATAAETISAYFDTVDARAQIATTLQTLDVLGDRAERTEERYRRGLSGSFELYQVRQDLRSVEASLPQREIVLDAAENRIGLLLSDYPEPVEALLAAPLTPRLVFEPVPAGLPVELLGQRPDVAAAWARLEAARERIGARRAERFPAIRLNAQTGTQGGSPIDLFDITGNWLLNLGANLAAPIFDAGRISANIRAARATYDEAAAAYGETVLTAYREVALATGNYEEQRQRYRLILAQLDEARASRDLQAERFAAGVGDYVSYLDALRALHQVESSLSAAGRDVALARLGVHRALGGDWEGTGAAIMDNEGGSE